MFDIQAAPFGKYTSYRLINQQSGEFVTVVPEVGANVVEMVLKSKDVLHSVIDGYKTADALEAHGGYRSSRLLPFPNRLKDGLYTFNGEQHQLVVNRPQEGHAIHGLFFNRPFAVTKCEAGPHESELTMTLDYTGDRPGYPYPFHLILTYTLNEGGFTSGLQVGNTGSNDMPFGDGWHPYFKVNGNADEWYLKIPRSEIMETDERKLPTGAFKPFVLFKDKEKIGTTAMDTGLRLKENGEVVTELFNKATDITLGIWQETGPSKYNFLQVYIPKTRDAVAIEPMTCAADAFNNGHGLIVLKPGEGFTAKFGVFLK